MAIILPHGVLFRGGAEARICRKLLDDGNIDMEHSATRSFVWFLVEPAQTQTFSTTSPCTITS